MTSRFDYQLHSEHYLKSLIYLANLCWFCCPTHTDHAITSGLPTSKYYEDSASSYLFLFVSFPYLAPFAAYLPFLLSSRLLILPSPTFLLTFFPTFLYYIISHLFLSVFPSFIPASSSCLLIFSSHRLPSQTS